MQTASSPASPDRVAILPASASWQSNWTRNGWICYPRFRALYAIIVAAVAIGLIGADFHFLSDIIAGAFVGSSTGWVAVVLWRSRNAEASGKL